MSKKVLAVGLVLVAALTAYYFSPTQRAARFVNQLVERNVTARGGESAWSELSSLRLTGQMDVGQGLAVPYVLEQKRPGKMRLEYVFDNATAIQATDGKSGWKVVPFMGKPAPEAMSESELREAADTGDLYGLLFDYEERGHRLEFMGTEKVGELDTLKLKVTLPRGSVRWVFLDAETALEIKVETRRTLAGKERKVETFYHDWQPTGDLLFARYQETLTEGDKESHFLTIESVTVNPPLDDSRFAPPAGTKPAPTQ